MYEKKRENYATDLEQFQDMVRQMDEHKSGLEQKVQERTEALATTNNKLDKMTTYINELKQTISEQEFSVDDIHKLESELKGLSEASDRAHSSLDQQRRMLLASQEELVGVSNNLDAMVSEYNARVAAKQLVPGMSSKFGPSTKARLDKEKLSQPDQKQILGVDLVTTVQPMTLSVKEEFAEQNSRDTETHNDLVDQLNRGEDARNETEAKVKIVRDKIAKCEQTLDSEDQTAQKKLSVRNREVKTIENKTASLLDSVALEETMAAYERQCAELEALRQEREEVSVAKYQAVLDEISSACQLMADHDQYVRTRVDELNQFWNDQAAQINDIVVPSNIDLSSIDD